MDEMIYSYRFVNREKLCLFENAIFHIGTLENDEFEDTIYYGHTCYDEMEEFLYKYETKPYI